MRLRIVHETQYFYDQPASGVIQILRLTPRNHDGQFVAEWRLDLSEDCHVDSREDAYGNIAHTFSADGPMKMLRVTAEGRVETQDTNGVIRDAVERFPPDLFLRETALTEPDEHIIAFARETAGEASSDTLALLHRLLERVYDTVTYDVDPTHAGTSAAEAFALKRGVCQDLTHIYISAARSLGIPARYIGGYYRQPETIVQQAGHAWAEAYVPDLGWVAFDPTHGVCTTEAHIRVAVGLDYLGAAPVRGTRYGGGAETLAVKVTVENGAAPQPQRQWQG
jgi:transglutaminase-like putative cysteine protease